MMKRITIDLTNPDIDIQKAVDQAVSGVCFPRITLLINPTEKLEHTVTYPYMSKSELETLIKLNVQDIFPVDISDHTIDYAVLEKNITDDNIHVKIVAVKNNILEKYIMLHKNIESIQIPQEKL